MTKRLPRRHRPAPPHDPPLPPRRYCTGCAALLELPALFVVVTEAGSALACYRCLMRALATLR